MSPARSCSGVAVRCSTCKKLSRAARRSVPLPDPRGGSLSNRSVAIRDQINQSEQNGKLSTLNSQPSTICYMRLIKTIFAALARTLSTQLRKGAWLPRGFTLSTALNKFCQISFGFCDRHKLCEPLVPGSLLNPRSYQREAIQIRVQTASNWPGNLLSTFHVLKIAFEEILVPPVQRYSVRNRIWWI